jgi:hypothetical protein
MPDETALPTDQTEEIRGILCAPSPFGTSGPESDNAMISKITTSLNAFLAQHCSMLFTMALFAFLVNIAVLLAT